MTPMTSPETTPAIDNRFFDVIELLLERQIASDSRRESAELEQRAALEQLQSQLLIMTQVVEALAHSSQACAGENPGTSGLSSNQYSAKSNSTPVNDSMTEWERQKQLLMQGLDSDQGFGTPAAEAENAESAASAEFANPVGKVISETTSHDWIEHLDPNDPALADDEARRELVARLRKLEVELSLQRAKIARERSDMETQLSEFEKSKRQLGHELVATTDGEKREPASRADRMLRFLGRKKDKE